MWPKTPVLWVFDPYPSPPRQELTRSRTFWASVPVVKVKGRSLVMWAQNLQTHRTHRFLRLWVAISIDIFIKWSFQVLFLGTPRIDKQGVPLPSRTKQHYPGKFTKQQERYIISSPCDMTLSMTWAMISFGDGSKPWYLVNPKIAGKWMFIPLKMYL